MFDKAARLVQRDDVIVMFYKKNPSYFKNYRLKQLKKYLRFCFGSMVE